MASARDRAGAATGADSPQSFGLRTRRVPALIAGVLFAAAASAAFAADTRADAQAAASACDGAHQDHAACQREKGAAKQEAPRGGLTDPGPAQEQHNALARCDAQPPSARAECEARIRGGGGKTTVEGSVEEGGVLRKTETPVPAAPR